MLEIGDTLVDNTGLLWTVREVRIVMGYMQRVVASYPGQGAVLVDWDAGRQWGFYKTMTFTRSKA